MAAFMRCWERFFGEILLFVFITSSNLVAATAPHFSEAEWNTKNFMRREHTLTKPYQSAGMAIPLWDFIGSTMVTQNYIRLTPDRQSRVGAIWNSMPLLFRDWEVQIHFKIHGSAKELYGDGLAIWYTKQRMQLGEVFGGPDYYSGLGLFLDTYANQNGQHNHNHPYVSASINNGSLHYDHDSDGTHTEIAGCDGKFRGIDHETYIAIRYERNTLTVSLDVSGLQNWKECFKVEGIHLPTGYFLGASAATGELADNHDIISIKVYEIPHDASAADSEEDPRNIIPSAEHFAPHRDRVEDSATGRLGGVAWRGFKLFLAILFAVVGVVALVIGGFYFYKKRQENSRKRFY